MQGSVVKGDDTDLLRYVEIKAKNGHGIKYESVKDDFDSSFFRDNYYDAFMMTGQIIKQNEKINSESGRNERPQNQDRLYNIITFCGERGTGKSSVMYSFMDALGESKFPEETKEFLHRYESRQNKQKSIVPDLEKCHFLCLEAIDASLLEKDEDILEVILAKMYKKYLEYEIPYENRRTYEIRGSHGLRGYGKEDIIRTLEKLYQYNNNKKANGSGESTVEFLTKLSNSLTMRETFKEFVPMYLNAIEPKGDQEHKFLVISIDDLDLGADGYERLEKLHRYLMVPGVIIYLALSGKEMQSICLNHFKALYSNPEDLTMDYMEKVLPYSQRVFLPSLLTSGFRVCIRPYSLGIKEVLLRKMIRRTAVAFDGCGLKTHFYEVGNLRTLVNLYGSLDQMETLPGISRSDSETKKQKLPETVAPVSKSKDSHEAAVSVLDEELQKRYLEIFDSNIERLRNDVVNRLALEKLTGKVVRSGEKDQEFELAKVFSEFCAEDSTRRGLYFVEFVKGAIPKGKFIDEYTESGYNYGEFLRSLYILGREKTEFKPLIHCILAYETIGMTHSYVHAFKDISADAKEKYMARWKESIGRSVCGTWGNYVLPSHIVTEQFSTASNKSYVMGYLPEREEEINILIPFGKKVGVNRHQDCLDLISSHEIVRRLEMIFMFIVQEKDRVGGNDADIVISVAESGDNSEEDNELASQPTRIKITLSKRAYTFDVFGFVVNSMEPDSFFERVSGKLIDAMKKYIGAKYIGDNPDNWNEIKKQIHLHSMKSEYKIWNETYKGMALPVYSVDIMYNILKRTKHENEKKAPKEVSEKYAEQIWNLYKLIINALESQDKFYEIKDGRDCGVQMKAAFENCPFIKNLGGSVADRKDEGKENTEKTETDGDLRSMVYSDIDQVINTLKVAKTVDVDAKSESTDIGFKGIGEIQSKAVSSYVASHQKSNQSPISSSLDVKEQTKQGSSDKTSDGRQVEEEVDEGEKTAKRRLKIVSKAAVPSIFYRIIKQD